MAEVHQTTLVPSKLDLLSRWLPTQPWYVGGEPQLSKSGGFRIDDPAGEVGIELLVVTDTSGATPVAYLVPMTYRGAPLPSGDDALIGTSDHGVLGKRWFYDAPRDPVFVEQSLLLLSGKAIPQHQHVSDALDPTVRVLAAELTPSDAHRLQVHRQLHAGELADRPGQIEASWAAGESTSRGVFLSIRS